MPGPSWTRVGGGSRGGAVINPEGPGMAGGLPGTYVTRSVGPEPETPLVVRLEVTP